MALGLWLSAREAARRGESPDDLLKAAEIALIGGLIGARLYYVLFNLDYYQTQPWWRIFAVWEGGLAIHGGLIAGVLAGGAYVWAKGLPLLVIPGHRGARARARAGDRPVGQLLQRGGLRAADRSPVEALHLGAAPAARLRGPPSSSTPPSSTSRSGTSGPFSSSYFVLRRRFERAPGALFLAYLGLYSLGRFWVEGLRTDSLMFGSLRVAQLVSVAAVGVAAVGIPILLRRRRT